MNLLARTGRVRLRAHSQNFLMIAGGVLAVTTRYRRSLLLVVPQRLLLLLHLRAAATGTRALRGLLHYSS